MDTKIISTITSHGPGYLDKSKEKIVGFRQISRSSVPCSRTAESAWREAAEVTATM